jgi:hypothetical protein
MSNGEVLFFKLNFVLQKNSHFKIFSKKSGTELLKSFKGRSVKKQKINNDRATFCSRHLSPTVINIFVNGQLNQK